MSDPHISALIRKHATRHTLGAAPRANIRAQIALAAAHQATRSPDPAEPAPRRPAPRQLDWRSLCIGMGSGVALTAMLAAVWVLPAFLAPTSVPIDTSVEASAEDALVADHVRSLQAGPLLSVASNDRHNVKPWFQGKLPFAPMVLNLEASGFPLRGARIGLLHGQKTAALVYGHKQHVLNLFVWPQRGSQAPQFSLRQGFSLASWQSDGLRYVLVSDMDPISSRAFVSAWAASRQALEPPSPL